MSSILYSFEQPDIHFHKQVFFLQGNIQNILVRDLNGDTQPDIMVLHNYSLFPDPHINRQISIFLQNQGQFSEHPTQTLLINNGEIILDIADINDDKIPELVFLKDNGVYFQQYADSGYESISHLLFNIGSVFLSQDPAGLHIWPFVIDLDNDNIPEIIIPQPYKHDIYSKDIHDNYMLHKRLWTSPRFLLSNQKHLQLSTVLPSLHISDFNDDQMPDLLFIIEDRLAVYLQYPNSSTAFPSALTPADFQYTMAARNLNPSVLGSLSPETLTLDTEDINNDGFVDILLSRASRAGFTANISQIQIYLNKSGRFDLLPDQILPVENFGCEHVIRDFNRDGLMDLGLLTFKIGFSQAVKFLFTKKASNSYDIFLMRDDHSYPSKPDAKHAFSRKVRISNLLESAPCVSFDGDFNGDKFKDLLIGTDSNEFSIFTGGLKKFFSKRAVFKLHVPVSTSIIVNDIFCDGTSDILIWYPDNPLYIRQFTLIKSIQESEE